MSRHSLLERKISFPPEAVFLSIVQDGDEVELWRVLVNHIKGVNVNRHNHAGVTALHQSVLNNNLDAVKMLLTHEADVNLADANGFTPLHTASACGLLQICSLLIVFGADLFLQTKDGDLAVDLAKDSTTTALLDAEMLRQLQQRTYFKAWLWYHFREYSVWMFARSVYYLRTAVQFLLRESKRYYERRRQTRPHKTTDLNSATTSTSNCPAKEELAPSPIPLPSSLTSSSSPPSLPSSQHQQQQQPAPSNEQQQPCKKTD